MSIEQNVDSDINVPSDNVVVGANPLLARLNKLPGSSIRLPSRGLFYSNGELDPECVDGEVMVFPMTVTDELLMRSSDMLFQGTAIDSVIKRCIPQIKKPLELLVGDIDYILTQLRRVSYGSRIPIVYECACAKTPEEQAARTAAGTNEYLIPVEYFIQHTKELSAKDFNKSFKIKLTNGQVVTLQPLKFSDFIKIQQLKKEDDLSDINAITEYVAMNFASLTKSVDDVTNKEHIKEWYKILPRFETELIKTKLDEIDNWGIDFKYTIKCRHCNEDKVVTTQLNPVYFFTLPSRPETQK